MMKKTILILLFIALLPLNALAVPSSVDRLTDHIEPIVKTDYFKASYINASSTTATSSINNALSIGSSTPFGNGYINVGSSTPLFYIDKSTGKIGVLILFSPTIPDSFSRTDKRFL